MSLAKYLSQYKQGEGTSRLESFAKRVDAADSSWEAEEEKRRKQQVRANLVAQAREANAQVGANTASNVSTFQKVKQYGGAELRDTGKAVVEGIKAAPERLGRGIARTLPGGTADLEAAEAEATSQNTLKLQISQRLKSKNLDAKQKKHFKQLLTNLNEDQDPATALTRTISSIKDDTDKSKFVGAMAEVASYFVGGAGLANAGRTGLTKAVASTAAGGALGGGGFAAQQDDASIGDIAKGAAIGAGTGVALAAGTSVIGNKVRNARSAPKTIASEIDVLDGEIAKATQAGDLKKATRLTKDHSFLQEQAQAEELSQASAKVLMGEPTTITGPNVKISSAAKKTEAKAIKENLVKSIDGLPTYSTMSLDDQAAGVIDFMDADYETAKKIAMGQTPAPEGLQASSFYKGVESRAVREGDVELMERLATESTIPKQATQAGQFNAALAYKDPESPVTAFRSIMEARKISALNVPRTILKEEADQVVSLAKEVARTKEAIASGGDRLAYGRARVAYDDYVQGLIAQANKKSLKEALKHPVDTAVNVAGLSKSLRASLDNSALLRQGWKTLFTHPGTWAKNSLKSFQDFAKTVGGKETLDTVRADIMSRPNSINGLYKKMGVDVFGIREEAFPTVIQEKLPIAGRFFKASDAAYSGFQQRTRADLADTYLEIAQRSGVDLTSKQELKSIGKLVNSLTSRGNLGRTGERVSKALNNVFFSPRLLKSNIDVLTAHQFQKGVTPFVRRRAARNLLQVAIGSAAALKLASEVTGGKNEWDPRSSNFGKIKIGDTRFDLSGGMSSIATLGARIATRSSKSSTSDEVKPLNSGEFGAQTTLDTLYNFFENKTSPAVSVIRDLMKGEDFDGNKPTVQSSVKNLVMPLIIANYKELKDNPRASAILPTMIAEGLGLSVNTYGLDQNWSASSSKSVKAFKSKVGDKKFGEANDKFNEQFNGWYEKVAGGDKFWSLPQEQRERLVTSKREALREEIMESYDFRYKNQPKTDNSTQSLIDELKKL